MRHGQLKAGMAVLLAFCSICTGTTLRGQTTGTGAVTGTVKDSSGSVVPGVSVTATEVATGIVTRTTTDGSGYSRISVLEIAREPSGVIRHLYLCGFERDHKI